jgi:Fic family protein
MSYSLDINPKLKVSLKNLDDAFVKAFKNLSAYSQEELKALHKYTRVSMIGASARLEGSQLTDPEVYWLDTLLTKDKKITPSEQMQGMIENKLSKDKIRNIEEVEGCRAKLMLIYDFYTKFSPLREEDILALHHTLLLPLKNSDTPVGQYKTSQNFVRVLNPYTGESQIIFEASPPGPITNSAMKGLIDWYNDMLFHLHHPVVLASEFVYRFLAIHPFHDGNGRLARGLFLLCLLQSKSKAINKVSKYISIDHYIELNKAEYYAVLNQCSKGKFEEDPKHYEIVHFLNFMIKILHQAIDGIESTKERFRVE